MIVCNLDLPRRFLSDSLSESDSQQFECHLETCDRCRAQLDLEAGGEGLEIWVREQLMSSSEVPLWSETVGSQTVGRRAWAKAECIGDARVYGIIERFVRASFALAG